MRIAGIGARALQMPSVPAVITRAMEELECFLEGAIIVEVA